MIHTDKNPTKPSWIIEQDRFIADEIAAANRFKRAFHWLIGIVLGVVLFLWLAGVIH